MFYKVIDGIAKATSALALAACLVPSAAHSGITHLVATGSSTNDFADFDIRLSMNGSAGGADNYDTWTDPNGHSGVKYFFFGLDNQDDKGNCYQLVTEGISPYTDPDTRIYAWTSQTTWRSVSDDVPGALTSKTRVWVARGKTVWFIVQGYDSNHNNIWFTLHVSRFLMSASSYCQEPGNPFLDLSTGTYPLFIGTN